MMSSKTSPAIHQNSRRARRFFLLMGLGALVPVSSPGLFAEEAVRLIHLELDEDSYWNGADLSGGFTTEGAFFNNDYDTEWDTWSGWSYSNVVDTETRGHLNQYAAITGEAVADHGIYGVATVNDFQPFYPEIELPAHTLPSSLTLTNTTYTYYSMLEGDGFGKQFGTDDDDWFLLTITGRDAEGESTGEIEFYLADYRFDDPEDAYIIDEWTSVDISSLGADTRSLEFRLSSSDTGDFGMNTPAYFALGELGVVAEDPFPAWMAMLPEEQKPSGDMRGPLDTPARDGMSNLLKYALGLMPMTPSAGHAPELTVAREEGENGDGNGFLAMEFERSQTAAVDFRLEGSEDLAVWEEVSVTTETTAELDGGRERVVLQSDVAEDANETYFLRLNVALSED